VDETIAFDATPSADPDGEIVSALWDMADGTAAETGRTDHAFTRPGVYQVVLTVTDNDGAEGTDTAMVTVNAPPAARFLPVGRIAPGQAVALDGGPSHDPDGEIRRVTWDFGDGTPQAQGLAVEHAFEQPGRYAVTLMVEDDSGALNGADRATRTVAVNHPPTAEAGDDRHVCRQTLRFDASSSADPDDDPLGFSWDFGDGAKGRGRRLVHTYPGPGLYPVALVVDDRMGLDNSTDQDKTVVQINGPPEAVIGVEGDAHCAGQLILFDAGASSDPEKGPLRYLWDFGDGESAEAVNPIHAYKKGGHYRVRLDVVDDSGLACDTGRAERILEVIDAPIADAGEDRTVCANVPLAFDGSGSTGGSRRIKSYEWDFGDGAFGVGPALSHVYARPGTYTARLTLTVASDGACGNTADDTVTVTVTSAPEAAFTAQAPGTETPGRACAGETVRFDAGTASAADGRRITAYEWDFGDGATGSGQTVEHAYEKTGAYPVSLRVVTDAETDCRAATHTETVFVNDPPDAVIEVAAGDEPPAVKETLDVRSGTILRFSGLGSDDADGHLVGYRWDFGDGQTAEGPTASHIYAEAGDYPVALQIADNSGSGCARNTARLRVRVASPEVAPIEGPERTCVDHEVSFSLPMDGPAEWHFSDGQTESGNPVARRFKEPGVYGVQAKRGDAWMEALSVKVMALPEIILPETVHAFPGDRVEIRPAYAPPADMDLIFRWDAGDGTAPEGETLRHEFRTAGDYNAALTIRAKDGPDCLTTTETVAVAIHPPPEAEIQVSPEPVYTGGARDAARFEAKVAGDPTRWTCRWDFGDGEQALGPVVYHRFRKPGDYEVALTLTDARHHTGRAFSVARPITVEKRP
jgi:PKD repeat protein